MYLLACRGPKCGIIYKNATGKKDEKQKTKYIFHPSQGHEGLEPIQGGIYSGQVVNPQGQHIYTDDHLQVTSHSHLQPAL